MIKQLDDREKSTSGLSIQQSMLQQKAESEMIKNAEILHGVNNLFKRGSDVSTRKLDEQIRAVPKGEVIAKKIQIVANVIADLHRF